MTRPIARRPAPHLVPTRVDRTEPGGPSPAVLAAARAVTAVGAAATAQSAARLVVIAGPLKGAECVLGEEVTTLGRGCDNGFVIADVSVSRRHSRVEREGKAWVLVDEGSGNGTRVGGRDVTRKKLRDGDRVAMGDTVLQFVAPGGIVARDRALLRQDRRRKPGARAVTIALLAVAAAGVAVAGQRLRARADLRADREETHAVAHRRLEQARVLLAGGNAAEALSHLRVAAELAPDAEIARTLAAVELQQPTPEAPPPAPALPARAPKARAHTSRSMIAAAVMLEGRPSAAHELELAAAATDEELPAAIAHARAALAVDPASAAARQRLGDLQARVHDLYLRGYVVRDQDREEARNAFRLVIAALPGDDETAQKAKRWLDKIEGKAAE